MSNRFLTAKITNLPELRQALGPQEASYVIKRALGRVEKDARLAGANISELGSSHITIEYPSAEQAVEMALTVNNMLSDFPVGKGQRIEAAVWVEGRDAPSAEPTKAQTLIASSSKPEISRPKASAPVGKPSIVSPSVAPNPPKAVVAKTKPVVATTAETPKAKTAETVPTSQAVVAPSIEPPPAKTPTEAAPKSKTELATPSAMPRQPKVQATAKGTPDATKVADLPQAKIPTQAVVKDKPEAEAAATPPQPIAPAETSALLPKANPATAATATDSAKPKSMVAKAQKTKQEVEAPPAPRQPEASPPSAERQVTVKYQDIVLVLSRAQPELTVGRDPSNRLIIHDSQVSRKHARLRWSDGKVVVEDSSANSTYIHTPNAEQDTRLSRSSTVLEGNASLSFGVPLAQSHERPVRIELTFSESSVKE